MADKKLNINITTKGAAKSKNEIKGLDGAITKMGKAVGIASAAYFGVKGLVSGLSSVITLAAEQELVEKKLTTALGKTSTALLDQASALQKVTTFGDEATIQQQAFLASIGFTEEKIMEIIPVAMDLATATGMTLESAVRNTAKTFSGLAGELGELVPQLRDLTAEEMKAGEAVKVMADLFGGQAKSATETMAGSIEQMNNAIGDAAEELGQTLSPVIISMAKAFKTAAEVVGSFFSSLRPPDLGEVIQGLKDINAEVELISQMEKLKLSSELINVNNELRKLGEGQTSLSDISERTIEITSNLEHQQKRFAEALGEGNDKQAGFVKGQIEKAQREADEIVQLGELIAKRDTLKQTIESLNESEKKVIETKIQEKELEEEISKVFTGNLELRKIFTEIVGTTDVAYQDYVKTQKENVKTQELEEQMIARFINQYPELAKQLGLVKIATDEAGYSSETFNDNLDTAIASSIASAGAISSTSNALRAAEDAAKQTSISFVSGEIQKAVALYIRNFLATTPLPPFISAPLALAGGAAFGSLMSSAISRNFADGGIVDGDPSKGDVVPAMLTAGEVILNQAQQENLVGGMGGVTINISAPLVDETVVDTIIPAIQSALNEDRASLNL